MIRFPLKVHLILLAGLMISCSDPAKDSATYGTTELPVAAETYPYEAIPGMVKAIEKRNGVVVAEGDALDGLKHGSWTTYDDKGLPALTTTYYKGKKQGVELGFDNRGSVEVKAYYHNDLLDGEYIMYKNRNITEKRNYKNGVLEGGLFKYYNSGKLMQESYYENGKLEGIAKWYDQEGNLSIAYEYAAGELVNKNPEVE